MNSFPIFVLIPTSRKFNQINNMINSLVSGQEVGRKVIVILIENGPKKDIEENIESLSEGYLNFRYIYAPDAGKSNALNYAIKSIVSENSLLIMPDDDVIFNPLWLKNIIDQACRYGNGHFFGGSMSVQYEVVPNPFIKQLLPRSAIGVSDQFYIENPNYLFFGCNWAAFSDDIIKAGYFDKRFGPGSTTGATGQETDMQNRLLAQGTRKVLTPNNDVTHFVSSDCINIQWIKHRIKRDTFSRVIRAKNIPKLILFFIFYTFLLPFSMLLEKLLLLLKNAQLYKKTIYARFLYFAIIKHYFLKKSLIP